MNLWELQLSSEYQSTYCILAYCRKCRLAHHPNILWAFGDGFAYPHTRLTCYVLCPDSFEAPDSR